MKKLFILLMLTGLLSYSQAQSDTYWTSGLEMIFSFAEVDYETGGANNVMRWAPVLNVQGLYNVDFSEKFGMYTGVGIRNVGYILDNYEDKDGYRVKKKFRTYNLGIPFGIKFGKMSKGFVYGGYEVEFPFQYKEKTFKDDNKTKTTAWFSDRVEQFQHAAIIGMQLPYGANIKFKYYFSEFHNQGKTESDGYKPYEGLTSNIFYFSLSFKMFKGSDFQNSENSAYY